MDKTRILRDGFVPIDRLIKDNEAKPGIRLAKGVLYRDDGVDAYGRPIFTKVGENTVTLGGAIAALERLTGRESSFRPNTLNKLLGVNDDVSYTYNLKDTTVALFGCGIGGASMSFDEVYAPSPRQNTLTGIVPMMVSQNELTGTDADKYMMRTTIKTPNQTTLNCWYLKEFDVDPTIRALWRDAANEKDDGSEIDSDVADVESDNGVEAFASFKLVFTDEDVRSYFTAIGEERLARFNTLGLFLGEKVQLSNGRTDYVNVSLFSVLNLNNEPLAERKKLVYYYRVYALI